MAQYTPHDLATRLKDGLLSFPVTVFDENLQIDEAAYREHLAWQSGFEVAGLFAAGGTGEGFSLLPSETRRAVEIAVSEAGSRVPILASAGGSVAQAVQNARDAEAAGAEGLLLFPPYLTVASQEGLESYAAAVCSATRIAVVIYNRANAIYSADTVARLADRFENLIGFKDATGDIERLARMYARNGERLIYIGGLPTAETFALPLLQAGMSTYSSAIFNFVPEFALEFYRDVRRMDRASVSDKLARFVLPYIDIRNRVAGYSVSIIKAGLTAVGRTGGPVRPPLQNVTDADLRDLTTLIRTSGVLPAPAHPTADALQHA